MKTRFQTTRERNINSTASGRTTTMRETRTFLTEIEAYEQLLKWEMEMEKNGWSIRKMDGETIRMTKVNDKNVMSYATLTIA